jgi:hypothetical protein
VLLIGTDPVIAQQLLNFGGQGHILTSGVPAGHAQGVVDAGQLASGEFNVQHRADDLLHDTLGAGGGAFFAGGGGSSSSHRKGKVAGIAQGVQPA